MEAMIKETAPHELNLRKMAVLGGVLHLDLLQQPPQPRELNKNLSLTVRKYFLRFVLILNILSHKLHLFMFDKQNYQIVRNKNFYQRAKFCFKTRRSKGRNILTNPQIR
jgi:hypothetical protein